MMAGMSFEAYNNELSLNAAVSPCALACMQCVMAEILMESAL